MPDTDTIDEPPQRDHDGQAPRNRSGRTIEELSAELDRLNREVSAVQAEIEELGQRCLPSPVRNGAHLPLTERESQVLRAFAWGMTTKDIAGQLSISVKSVDTYRARGFRKLGLDTRQDLVRYAVRHGWLIDPAN